MAQTPEHLLYVLYEFKSKADIYGCIGAEVFEIFFKLLIGNARHNGMSSGHQNCKIILEKTLIGQSE